MELPQVVMALQLCEYRTVSVGDRTVFAVPGDVVVDNPTGERTLLHKIEFEEFVEKNGYTVSGDIGQGWVSCRKTL